MAEKIDSALSAARARLAATGDSAQLDARLLLEHVLDANPAWLIAHGDRTLSASDAKAFDALIERRVKGEPVAYLTGTIGFWSLDLNVDARVLVPRPDTETLVEAVLDRLDEPAARVADLGTGSGAIALALACERPQWRLYATDADAGALNCARANAARLNLGNVRLARGDWLEPLAGQRFDAIVANPPYIDGADPHLRAPALGFEPQTALIAAKHGLADLAHIIAGAPAYLAERGWLLLEHGFEQAAAVRKMLEPNFDSVETLADLGGRPRVTLGRKKIQRSHET